MSDHKPVSREAIDRVAVDLHKSAHVDGRPQMTHEQARARVVMAVERGDRKREDGNR